MLRSFTTLSCSLLLITAFAQRGTIKVVDTDAMRKYATAKTTEVDKVVELTGDQRPKVNEVYMAYERSDDALAQRYARAEGMTPEGKAEELKRLHIPLQQQLDQALAKILTAEQWAKWTAAGDGK